MLNSFAGHRHIANLGHGVYPDVNPDHVNVLLETVKSKINYDQIFCSNLIAKFSFYAIAQDHNNLVPNSSFESIEGKFKN